MKIDIKRITEVTGLTQTELAEKVGCTPQYISNLKKGHDISKPYQILTDLSKLSKISINKLIIK
jgi:predicted transcriptional regulator